MSEETINKGIRSMWWMLLVMWTILLAKIIFKDQSLLMGVVSIIFIWKNIFLIKLGVPQ